MVDSLKSAAAPTRATSRTDRGSGSDTVNSQDTPPADSASVTSSSTLPDQPDSTAVTVANTPNATRQLGVKNKRAASPEWPISAFKMDYPDDLLEYVRILF